nr:RHS domain-containing protein [Stenotrophomonas geniculata]
MNGLCSLLIRAVLTVVVLAACVAPAVAQEVVEYIHTDALGSPVAITDASGNVIERTVYEPYGAVVNRPLKDGPGYTGHVTDSGTGLSYMQQRYYDFQTVAFWGLIQLQLVRKGLHSIAIATLLPIRISSRIRTAGQT